MRRVILILLATMPLGGCATFLSQVAEIAVEAAYRRALRKNQRPRRHRRCPPPRRGRYRYR